MRRLRLAWRVLWGKPIRISPWKPSLASAVRVEGGSTLHTSGCRLIVDKVLIDSGLFTFVRPRRARRL